MGLFRKRQTHDADIDLFRKQQTLDAELNHGPVAEAMKEAADQIHAVRSWMQPVVKMWDDTPILWVRMNPYAGALVVLMQDYWVLNHRLIDEDGDPGEPLREPDEAIPLFPWGCEIAELVHELVGIAAMGLVTLVKTISENDELEVPLETKAWVVDEVQSLMAEGWLVVEDEPGES